MCAADAHDRVRSAIRATLAADCACAEDAFIREGVRVVPFAERPGRRRYSLQAHRLAVMTMGAGVVVSCDDGRVARVEDMVRGLDRDAVFSGTTIARLAALVEPDGQLLDGPNVVYACGAADLRPAAVPNGIALEVVAGDAVTDLYQYPGFPNALAYPPDREFPDVLVVVARRAGQIVGMAGASADCDALWQIGVDVVPDARERGIGRAMVAQLTAEVLRAGRLPFYAAAVSNIGSRAIALGLGYWPAWVELNARNHG